VYFIWQVAGTHDANGTIAQCNIWLITRLQKWVADLGHQGVYSQFIQGLDTIKDQQTMAIKWGTPDNVRLWLTANGADDNGTERALAIEYAYPGTDPAAGNPIAQERIYAQRLERVLVEEHRFKGGIPINKDSGANQDRILSQKVSGKYMFLVNKSQIRELSQVIAQS
jgi:hypothetical protein